MDAATLHTMMKGGEITEKDVIIFHFSAVYQELWNSEISHLYGFTSKLKKTFKKIKENLK